MNAKSSIFAVIIIFFTATAGWAQEYQLDWEQVNNVSAGKDKAYTLDWEDVSSHVDRAAPAPVVQEMPETGKVAMMGPIKQVSAAPSRAAKAPTYNIEFSSSQYYDTYDQRYLQVTRVEVETFRMGTYTCETFENRGAWNSFPVFVNNLKKGERFRVRVVWDDGSNRTIDKTVNDFTASTIFIDQPDYLAYKAW